jgi:signal transduction histidine kinase/CheY-like chemotaxis protein/sensor domain CHASE-containing protein
MRYSQTHFQNWIYRFTPAAFLAFVAPVLLRSYLPSSLHSFISHWSMMQFNTAVGLLAASTMIWAVFHGHRKIASAASALVLAIGASACAEHLFSVNLGVDQLLSAGLESVYLNHPGRMPFNASVAFIGLGLAAACHLLSPSMRLNQISALFSAFSGGLGLFKIASKVLAYETGNDISSAAYMGFTSAIALLTLSLLMGNLAYQRTRVSAGNRLMRLPLLASVSLLTISLFFWQYSLGRESANSHKVIELLLAKQSAQIQESLKQTTLALKRYADRVEILGTSNSAYIEKDSQNYLDQLPTLSRMGITNKDFKVEWSFPNLSRLEVAGFSQLSSPQRAQAFIQSRDSKNVSTSTNLQLRSGSRGFLIIIPMFVKTQFRGTVYGAVRAEAVFNGLVNPSEFSMRVSDPSFVFYSQPANTKTVTEFTQSTTIENGFARWTISLTPTALFLSNIGSDAPTYFMLLGVIISLMVGWILERSLSTQIVVQNNAIASNIELEKKVAARAIALRRKDKELIDLQKRTALMLDSVNAIVWAVDVDGTFTFYHGLSAKILGIPSNDRIGRRISEIIDMKPYSTELMAQIDVAVGGGRGFLEIHRGGKIFHTEVNAILDSDSGAITGAVGVSMDVTESAAIKNKLSITQERLRTVLQKVPFAFWAVGKNRRVLFREGIGMHAVAKTAADMVGRSIDEIYKGFPHVIEAMNRAFAGESFELTTQIGIRWYTVACSTDYDLNGEVSGISGVTFDFTDRKLVEDERNEMAVRERSSCEASRLKSDFLANMSHEIRTPINGVIGMTGLLLGTPLTKEQSEFAEHVRGSADALLCIINDILDFSKVEAGKLELEEIEFDLAETLHETVATLNFAAKKKGLPLLLDISSLPSCTLLGDPGRIRQVITNLVGNAIKFTMIGQISLKIVQKQSSAGKAKLRFEITDTGIGIAKSAIPKMFQPFSQGDASTARKFGGTGLGLSISKHLVELMDGSIGVHSEEGIGSTFWLELELLHGKTPIQSKRKNPSPLSFASSIAGARILVADDNVINQKIVLKYLERMGCHGNAVANGKEVLEALRSFPYDVVLMDCQMPEMDGYECTRTIRASATEPFKTIPVIALTANSLSGDMDLCLNAGMDDYISKPFKFEAFTAVLEKWVSAQKSKSVA